jgi:hypothetical protein
MNWFKKKKVVEYERERVDLFDDRLKLYFDGVEQDKQKLQFQSISDERPSIYTQFDHEVKFHVEIDYSGKEYRLDFKNRVSKSIRNNFKLVELYYESEPDWVCLEDNTIIVPDFIVNNNYIHPTHLLQKQQQELYCIFHGIPREVINGYLKQQKYDQNM